MQVQENFSLRPFNTFGIDARARYFSSFNDLSGLTELLTTWRNEDKLILGGGSNLLFTQDYPGLVLKNEIRGISIVKEDDEFAYVKAGAGENWHAFVQHCIGLNLAGIENLSLIPGCVGASPMQNIGAYGVEIKDVFEELNAFHIAEHSNYRFNMNECAFGYRESVFKGKYKNQFVITDVTFRLRKQPVFHIDYGAIRAELEAMGISTLSIRAISDAVIKIRQSKLPDPLVTGNAGSFFKNPSVSAERYAQLQQLHPGIVGYENADGTIKLAAGWLIEQCGWKGFRQGDAGVHPKQALVLVNYKDAAGSEIFSLSTRILESVVNKFGVQLEREVNII